MEDNIRNNLLTKDQLIDKFGAANYAVFGAMLLVSVLIGVFFWLKGRRTEGQDLLTGGRSMGLVPVSLSLMASFMSSIGLLGTPAEMYVSGTMYGLLAVPLPLALAVVAYVYLPVFYSLQVTTSYQYHIIIIIIIIIVIIIR